VIDETRLTFGVIQYSGVDPDNDPDRAVRAIEMFATTSEISHKSFQGMFASTDRWSRRSKVSPRSLSQLRVDLRGGVYSHIVVYLGERNRELATLTIDCMPASPTGGFPLGHRLAGEVLALGGWHRAEEISLDLWDILGPGYGFSVFGRHVREVQSELTGIPHTLWGESDPAEEARLLHFQALRHELGHKVRDAAWGNFLGHALVTRLGGLKRIRAEAPAALVREISHGGVYIRMSEEPSILQSNQYQEESGLLREFLRPVLAT